MSLYALVYYSAVISLVVLIMISPLFAEDNEDRSSQQWAQETDENQAAGTAPVSAPALPPPPAAPAPLESPPPMPQLGDGDTVANIQFPNADVRHVLAFYEQLTGKQVIYDNTVQGQVNIVVSRTLSREQAIQAVETVLQINGFTVIPGPGDWMVKVVGTTKNARQFAIPMISDLADLPDGDQVVTFVFHLEYADPTQVQELIGQYVAQTANYTALIPLPKVQALMVTETAGVVRRIGQIVETVDIPPAEVISEFIALERAGAKEVVEKLTTMLELSPGTGNMPYQPTALPPRPSDGQGGPTGRTPLSVGGLTPTEESMIVGKIKLTADERTNRVHVVTRPANIAFIRKLIADFDANVSYGAPSRRVLRFVSAGDVLDVVVEAITEPGVTQEQTQGTQARVPATRRANNIPASNSSSGVNMGSEELAMPDIDTAPEARTVGSTRIIADKRSNAIIVMGNEESKRKIFHVLDEIDIRSPQVMLTAVIGELTLDDGEEFGVNYIYHLGRTISKSVTNEDGTISITQTRPNQAFAGASRNNALSLTDLATLTSVSAFTGVPAGTTAFIGATDSLDIIVSALESTGRFRITSRPMVFTSNNRKAIITSGQQIAVPGTTTSGFTGGSDSLITTSNVQYKDVALKLEVLPLINSDGEVTLDIVQEVNSVGGVTEISGNRIPTINARKIKTTVSVANEATIALGGLVQESNEKTKTGIPVLHQLPLVGRLFGHEKQTMKRTELIVLLRPTVTYDPMESSLLAEQEQEKLNFPADIEAALDAAVEPKTKRVPTPTKPRVAPLPRVRNSLHR